MVHVIPKGARVEIIRPGMPLDQWYAKQTVKPWLLCNASLYDMDTGRPVGTILADGAMVSNAGNGFGFGVRQDGSYGFGAPWGFSWWDYVSGYPGIVQQGKVVPPTWRDDEVFLSRRLRIGIGEINGQACVIAEEGKTMLEFGAAGVAAGLTYLVALDGGASVDLRVGGTKYYTSTRKPYNAIAVYLPGVEVPEKGKPMNVTCQKKTATLDRAGAIEKGRYIDTGDRCTIRREITDNLLIEIEYPTGAGKRTAYLRSLEGFIPG